MYLIAQPAEFRKCVINNINNFCRSHDSFVEDPETGYLNPAGDKYADQRRVFDDLGAGVLDNAFKGERIMSPRAFL